MKIWAEIFDVTGAAKLGVVRLHSAQVSRRLDGIGKIAIRCSATDVKALELLQIRRRFHLYYAEHDNPTKKLVVRGYLTTPKIGAGDSKSVAWEGVDELAELTDTETLAGRFFDDAPIEAITEELLGLVSGWNLTIESGLQNTSKRFDNMNVFRALSLLAVNTGLHLRLAGEIGSRWLALGLFGTETDIRISNARSSFGGYHNPNLVYVDRLEAVQEGGEIVNWIIPVIGGGDAPLTLRRSTESAPYPIESAIGPDGRKVYYLKDDTSIAQYGIIQRTMTMDEAVPIKADSASLINASNALYQWAATQLDRLKQPQWVYRLSSVKLNQQVRPGDKVRLAYKGMVWRDNRPIHYLDVNEFFWVLQIDESYNEKGKAVSWDISAVDGARPTTAERIADAMIRQREALVGVKLNANVATYSTIATISTAAPITVDFNISSDVLEVGRATVIGRRFDTNGPQAFLVTIDGQLYNGVLSDSGPFLPTPADGTEFRLDIDDFLGTLQGDHTITVSCLSGSGTMVVEVRVTEITASIV